jgi:hypothetical protein
LGAEVAERRLGEGGERRGWGWKRGVIPRNNGWEKGWTSSLLGELFQESRAWMQVAT